MDDYWLPKGKILNIRAISIKHEKPRSLNNFCEKKIKDRVSKLKLSQEYEKKMIQLQLDHLSQKSLEVYQVAIDCLIEGLFGKKDSDQWDKIWSIHGLVVCCNIFGPLTIRKNVIWPCLRNGLEWDPSTIGFWLLCTHPLTIASFTS